MTEIDLPPQKEFSRFASGEWQRQDAMIEYRAEWFNSLLVERAAWSPNAPQVKLLDREGGPSAPVEGGASPGWLHEQVIGGPGYVWFRFWLPELDQMVEKYFEPGGDPIGHYLPICRPLERKDKAYRTSELILAIWYNAEKRVAVLREEEFDESVRQQLLSSKEAERAEKRIRELTAKIFREEFPPPLVRNFAIAMEKSSHALE